VNTAPRKRALLIGITQYQWSAAYTPPFDLVGPAQDVATMAAVLQAHFGFAAGEITTLGSAPGTDAAHVATGAQIRQALQALAEQTQAGDTVLIYYSGHGSQWPDLNGDEPDGFDESIVPYDARDPQVPTPPHGDILDDELHTYLAQIAGRTANLTAILDCCHSASGTRADEAGLVRELPYNLPLQASNQPAPAAQAAAAAASPRPTLPARTAQTDQLTYVTLAACQADERAYESALAAGDALWPEEQPLIGQSVGLFTYYLARALRHGPTATYQDILTFLQDQVTMRRATQHPAGEGPLSRQVLGGSTTPVDWLPVQSIAGTALVLAAGTERGLAAGAGVQVFPNPDATTTSAPLGQERPIGTATIRRVFPFQAEATFDQPPISQPAQARALVIRPVYPGRQLRVAVRNTGAPTAAAAAIAAALAGRAILQIVPPDTVAPDALVDVTPAGITFTVGARAPDGQPLPPLAPLLAPTFGADPAESSAALTQLAEPAANRLTLLAGFRDGLARSNPGSALDSQITMTLRVPGAPLPVGEPALAPLAQYTLVLTYDSAPAAPGGPLYFSLFRFGADGAVSQIYPPEGAQERLVPGQQWPPPGQEDYFTFTVDPPTAALAALGPVRDRLKLFVATAPLDLRGLQQPAISTAPTRGDETALTRGGAFLDPADQPPADWTSLTVSYRIVSG